MTVWKFASPPPETGTGWTNEDGETEILGPLPDCPRKYWDIPHGELLAAHELCELAWTEAVRRLALWEFWAGTEREAHERLRDK